MTCFVADDGAGAGDRLGNGGTAVARFMTPLRAYLQYRSRKRVAARFAAVDLHTLEDIGLLRTHFTAACVSGDNDNNPDAVARAFCGCTLQH